MNTDCMGRHARLTLPVLLVTFATILSAQQQPGTQGSLEETQQRLWLDLKKALTASDGREYFRLNLLNALIPGRSTYGIRSLKGNVISSELVGTTRTIVIAISDKNTPEVTLRLGRLSPADVRIPKGAVVEFEGVGAAFTPSPFMLTFDVSVCRQVANEAELKCELESRAPK